MAKFRDLIFHFKLFREIKRPRIEVAILDTGVEVNHPNFQRLRCQIKGYKSFVADDDGSALKDSHGHGTHIAGILLDLISFVDVYIAKVTDNTDKVRLVDIAKVSQICCAVSLPTDCFNHRHSDGHESNGASTSFLCPLVTKSRTLQTL